MSAMSRSTRVSSACASLLFLLFCLCCVSSFPTPTSANVVIVDLSSAAAPPTAGVLPKKVVGLSALDFGLPGFPTSPPLTASLLALPLDNAYGCEEFSLPTLVSGALPFVVLIRRGGNCTFVEKARRSQRAAAVGMIVVNSAGEDQDDVFEMVGLNATLTDNLHVPSMMLSYAAGEPLIQASLAVSRVHDGKQKLPPNFQNFAIRPVMIHVYTRSNFDGSFIAMLLLATAVVMYAAYLSAAPERRVRAAKLAGLDSGAAAAQAPAPSEGELVHEYLTQRHAFGFIVGASLSLIILFYFISLLIYVLIFVFCLAGLQSITHLGATFLRWLYPHSTRTVMIPHIGEVSLYTLLSFVAGLVLTLTWVIRRNQEGAWALQDLLGVSLLLVIQQAVRLPDIKVSTILLVMAFVYDVFWVFISGYIFKSSVMLSVASGGGTGEAVPMLLRLPRFNDELSGGYSMLGLGDIALPGLLVSYLLRFDLSSPLTGTESRPWTRSYFALVSVGYAAGLVVTYIALMASSSGQPALLYLVPCTLGLIVPVAWRRGELGEMWQGQAGSGGGGGGGGAAGGSSASSALSGPSRSHGQYSAVSAINSAPSSDADLLQLESQEHDLDHDHDHEDAELDAVLEDDLQLEEDDKEMMANL